MKKIDKYNLYHKNTSSQALVLDKNNFTYKNILNVLSKYLKPGGNVLDIGCGAGSLSFYLAKNGKKVLGIDVSSEAINACRETAKLLKLKNAGFSVLDFPKEKPSGKFDLIVFSEVLEHIKEEEKAFIAVHSLLAKNGILFLTTPSSNAPLYRLGLLKNFDKRVGHIRRYSQKELTKKLEKHGFMVLESHKKEGILRNLLFTNDFFGKAVRIFNKIGILAKVFTLVDNIMVQIFGESQIIIVARKN